MLHEYIAAFSLSIRIFLPVIIHFFKAYFSIENNMNTW